AGYLNYTTNTSKQVSAQTAMEMEASDDMQIADVGDATLVSSNDVVENVADENLANNTMNSENTTTSTDSTEMENNTDTNLNTSNENKTATETSASYANDEYFTKSKLERDTMYSQMIESYENVLNSSNALETQKQSATEEI